MHVFDSIAKIPSNYLCKCTPNGDLRASYGISRTAVPYRYEHCKKSRILLRIIGGQISQLWLTIIVSLCGSVGKDFVCHACGHEFESRPKWKFSNFPHHLWLVFSDYRGVAKWFEAHFNQEVRFSSAFKCKKVPQVLTSLLNQRRN